MKGIKFASFFFILALSLSLTMATFVFAAEKTIKILHTNDSHGRLVGDSGVIGIDIIAQIKHDTPNSLLVDAGDAFHGLPFVTVNAGYDAVELMNLAGYDVFTPGNHDFNYGYLHLLELTNAADFDVLSANVMLDGEPLLKRTAVKVINGIKIGFFGVTTPETAYKTNPLNVYGLEFDDVVKCSRAALEELKAQEADVIVALTHLGTDETSKVTSLMLASELPEIDVIIDGHSHTYYENGFEINGVLLASAGEYEQYVGSVDITLDDDNNIIDKKASLIDNEIALASYTPNEIVKAKIDAIINAQSEITDVVVAELGYTLSAQHNPGVRTKEMPLGNLVADALKDATGADIAFINGVGLHQDLNGGSVTKGNIIAVLPFGNYGVTKLISPKDLKDLMENGVAHAPTASSKFPQISGFNFTYDPALPVGDRVTEIIYKGEALDLTVEDTVLLLATSDFIAVGGDGYISLLNRGTVNEFDALDEILLAYITNNPDIEYVETEDRITSLTISEEAIRLDPEVMLEPEETFDPEEINETSNALDVSTPTSATVQPVIEKTVNTMDLAGQIVNCNMVNIRTGASTQNGIITTLKVGAIVEILDFTDMWVKILYNDVIGWIYDDYIEIIES